MLRSVLLVWLCLTALVHASFIAAWKISIGSVVPGHKTEAKLRKLERPPGESVFFHPGDELWDLSEVLEIREGIPPFEERKITKVPWRGDWVVWNASLGIAVACGSQNDLLVAERVFAPDQQSIFYRWKFDWSRGAKDEIIHRFGSRNPASERADVEIEGVKVALNCSGVGPNHIDMHFCLSWPDPDGESTWEITSACVIPVGKRVRIMNHLSGEDRWSVHGTISLELEDGTPLSESRWIDKDGKRQIWSRPAEGPDKLPADGALSLVRYEVGSGFLGLGENSPVEAEIEAPESLRQLVRGRYPDSKKFFRHIGVPLKSPDSFVVYDRLLSVVVAVADEDDHDLLLRITNGLDCYQYQNHWIDCALGPKSIGFVGRAGMKTHLSKSRKEEEDMAFEIGLGWEEEDIDLAYDLSFRPEAGERQKIKSAGNYARGIGRTIGRYRLSDTSEREVKLSVSEFQP